MQLLPQALPLLHTRQQERCAPASNPAPHSEMDSGTTVRVAAAAKIAMLLIMASPPGKRLRVRYSAVTRINIRTGA